MPATPQSAGGLEDAARVLEHVLDGGADGVGVDHHVVVDEGAGNAEGLFADQLHRGAVGKQADIGERHAPPLAHRLQHRVGVHRLHADHAHLGTHGLDVTRHARNQTAAADGHEDGVQRALVLAQDLHRHRALAGDDIGIVEGMHESQALVPLQQQRMAVGVGVAVAMQHDLAAQGLHGVDLQARCRHRHHDDGAAAQALGRQRHTLGVVAGRGADHAARQHFRREPHHLVVGAAQLEAENGLLVFTLEQHVVGDPARQVASGLQRRLARHVVDARGQNFLEIIRCLHVALPCLVSITE